MAITSTPPQQFCPAVSVIIPMYNAEKYIGECLNSILAQTFTNFEVIVVDDYSTDNGAAIVESYMPKFNGKLKLLRTEKNSGSAAVPRNDGLMISRGKYAFFVDGDDVLTKNALEKLYSTMESFDGELIFCTRNYLMNENGLEIKEVRIPLDHFEEKIVLYEDFTKRVDDMVQNQFWREPWRSFCRRDFLIENKIFFPHIRSGEDVVWFYALFFYVKKILLMTEPIYFYRQSEDSVMRAKRSPADYLNYWLNPVIIGLKTLESHFRKIEFFQQNPQYKYAVLEVFIRGYFNRIFSRSCQLSPVAVYETIKQEFGDKLGEYDVLVSALCTVVNTQQKIFAINQQKFNQFAAQAQKRIAELEAQITNDQKFIAELKVQLK